MAVDMAGGVALGRELGRDAAVDLDQRGGEGGELAALVVALRVEVGLKHGGRRVAGQRPDQLERRRPEDLRPRRALGLRRDVVVQRLLEVILAEQRQAEALGQRAGEGGLAGARRAGDDHESALGRRAAQGGVS